MEEVTVSGVAADREPGEADARCASPTGPGIAAHVFGPIAAASIVVDMIIQNASADGTTDLTFTVPRDDYDKARTTLDARRRRASAPRRCAASSTSPRCRSSGSACARTPASRPACSTCSPTAGINIQMISTSEIKISVVIDAKYAELARARAARRARQRR